MANLPSEAAAEIKNGKLISGKVTDEVSSKIEKGEMKNVNGLIVHQTGGSSAKSALESYKAGKAGAHFLIDKDGTIYQTARVTQKCHHVGTLRSRCYEAKSCDADELKRIKGMLFKKGQVYSGRVKALGKHEQGKATPDRYPSNEDSIGIEIVGGTGKDGTYEIVNNQQNASLKWLVATLVSLLSISADEVHRHPDVSYKQSSEASTASW